MIYSLILAFILDYIIGDPYWLWHPICGIGSLISKTESIIRYIFPKTLKGERIGGILLFIVVVFISFSLPFILLYFLFKINFGLGFIVNTFFCTQIFAANCLKKETVKVYDALNRNDIERARTNISYLVGRDTQRLSREEIIKATVETIAENTTDGVTAPMFYMIIGGAPLGFLYKAVNTLDSMIGYKNEKYINIGRFSAKADDLLNFVPARITAIFMIISSFILKLNYKNAFKIFKRDRNKHSSPNAGQTESVTAGALEIQLGGDAYYFSQLYKKASIGDKIREVRNEDILITNKIMYLSSFFCLLFLVILRFGAEVLLCKI